MGERLKTASTEGRVELVALAGVTAVFLAVRALAATRVGFGDSEALYAAYAVHPQPAYLDHPGLVGEVAALIGGGTAPSPERAHLVTAVLAALVPWLMALACRASGASARRSLLAALVFAVVPEIAVGLFALTPDLLLSLAWLGALALAAAGLAAAPGSARANAALAGAGLLAGTAAAAKVSGVLLLVSLAATYASRAARPHARTAAPWAGLLAGAIVILPVAAFEARAGWPLLVHRLVDTQKDAGVSLRNLGALLGGQVAYVSPGVLVLVVMGARAAWRDWRDARGGAGAVATLLLASSAIPAAVLVPLSLWSRVAEPHWVAPAMLSLGPALARSPVTLARRLLLGSTAIAAVFTAAVYAWVLIPGSIALMPGSYDARYDIANELYGWPEVLDAVHEVVAAQA
ncbi:MAG TPA: glycosyltransferase family 39 protein, partial [Polyangiaceae bacterium]|nr:glycosyltransferase family 39 protein [Polyangiaceae bacterium]